MDEEKKGWERLVTTIIIEMFVVDSAILSSNNIVAIPRMYLRDAND